MPPKQEEIEFDNVNIPTEEDEDRGDLIADPDEDEGDEDITPSEKDENDEDEESHDEEDEDEDEDEDGDEEGDSEEEDEGEEEDDKSTDRRIPRSRLNQVIAQREELREKTEWLESQLDKALSLQQGIDKTGDGNGEPDAPAYDYADAESKYINLILEGEVDKAIKLREEINRERNLEVELLLSNSVKGITEESSKALESRLEDDKFQEAVAKFEDKYPFLNQESDSYDEETVDIVNSLMNGYSQGGMSKTEALSKAVKGVASFISSSQEDKIAEDSKSKLGSKERKAKGRKRNSDTSRKQPPKLKNSKGSGSNQSLDDINVSDISDKQFSQLTLKEKKQLRGDL